MICGDSQYITQKAVHLLYMPPSAATAVSLPNRSLVWTLWPLMWMTREQNLLVSRAMPIFISAYRECANTMLEGLAKDLDVLNINTETQTQTKGEKP